MAFQGIDSRDLYRRGSGMTLRRLGVLIGALPADSPLWVKATADHEQALRDVKVRRLEEQAERLGRRSDQ